MFGFAGHILDDYDEFVPVSLCGICVWFFGIWIFVGGVDRGIESPFEFGVPMFCVGVPLDVFPG